MAPEFDKEGGTTRTLADRYVLGPMIGRGGMGAVYSAHDEWEQRRVAIKLIKDRRASEGRAWRMFSRELRAVIRLSHPGIVSVYDYGIDDEGLPFFVMEYVPGVALAELDHEQLRWMDIVDIFEQVLETLAYAHARGIIHRDIKPDNFLIAPGDGRPRLKLVDFGIAKLLGERSIDGGSPEKTAETLTELAKNFTLSDATVGTPAYMAPELGLNELYLVGPQTDLYSVGCMLYEFVAGHRPYDGRNIISLILAHINSPIPTLHGRDGQNVPMELERLVRALLGKDARQRPWCAADVLEHIHRVPDFEFEDDAGLEPIESRVLPQLLERSSEIAAAGDDESQAVPGDDSRLTRVDPPNSDELVPDAPTIAADPEGETLADDSVRATVPVYRDTTPAADRSGEFDAPLAVTRLGVAALREPKLVGREAQQQWLLEHVRDAIRSGRPKALLLRGRQGIGRGRLARWVAEEFAERGACRVLRLTFEGGASEADMLRDAIRAALGVGGDDDLSAVLSALPGSEALSSFPVAARYLSGADITGGTERVPIGLIQGLLNMVRREKALMVVVENLGAAREHGLPEFLLSALRRGGDWPWPMIVVGSLEEASEDDVISAMLEHDACHVADLQPLSTEAGSSLLQSLLPLRDMAAERIAEYAGGVPDVMLQLLRALGASGDIYASGGQYWVKPEAWDDLTHVDDVYATGVERWVEVLDDEEVELTLIASLVGMEPEADLLEAIVQRLGLPMDVTASVEVLLEEGILVGTEDGGLRFEHALMREAWQARATSYSDYTRWQEALGREFDERAAPRGRVGLHLYESGEEDAFDFLLEGGLDTLEQGDYALAAKYLTAAKAAVSDIDVGAEDGVDLGAALGRLAIRRSNRELFTAALEVLSRLESTPARGWRSWVQGAWAARSGSLQLAQASYREAVRAFDHEESPDAALRARESLADALRKAADYRGAEREATRALELAETIDDDRAAVRLLRLLGFICLETERYAEAADYASRARDLGQDSPDRSELGRALKIECGALMRLGRVDDAFERGQEALTIFRELGDAVGELSMLNLLAMLRHEAGSFGQARQFALEALERSQQIGEQSLRGRILNNLGHACEELGRMAEARQVYTRALHWSHVVSDLQNEARVCFNFCRLLRGAQNDRAIVLAERSRRILEALDLPYLSESERVLDEFATECGREHVDQILADYDAHLETIREEGRDAGP